MMIGSGQNLIKNVRRNGEKNVILEREMGRA